MKIPRLFTSIGFGLFLKSLTSKEFCELTGAGIPRAEEGQVGIHRLDSFMLRLRNDYDKFLLQEVKPEMFYQRKGIEKKVIFAGFEQTTLNTYMFTMKDGCMWNIDFDTNGMILHCEQALGVSTYIHPINTVLDLAIATNGMLPLKNVSL